MALTLCAASDIDIRMHTPKGLDTSYLSATMPPAASPLASKNRGGKLLTIQLLLAASSRQTTRRRLALGRWLDGARTGWAGLAGWLAGWRPEFACLLPG